MSLNNLSYGGLLLLSAASAPVDWDEIPIR